jgi:hypothetical protein
LVFIRLFFAVELILRKGGTKYEEKEWGNWRGDEKESQLTVLYFFSFKKWKDWQLDSVLKVVEGFGKCSRGVSECQKPQGKVKCRIVKYFTPMFCLPVCGNEDVLWTVDKIWHSFYGDTNLSHPREARKQQKGNNSVFDFQAKRKKSSRKSSQFRHTGPWTVLH